MNNDDNAVVLIILVVMIIIMIILFTDKSLKGWKEVEYEVVRDAYDNCITVSILVCVN